MTPTLIIGGICLTGKTTLVRALEAKLRESIVFIEGDDLHTAASIEKMRSGQPLDEADRLEWKQRICALIADPPTDKQQVITCSALKRAFRDDLRRTGPVKFIFLVFGRTSAEKRAAIRPKIAPEHYFQPARHPALLDGQYRDLETPESDEPDCLVIDLDEYPQGPNGPEPDVDDLCSRVLAFL